MRKEAQRWLFVVCMPALLCGLTLPTRSVGYG
jgi:hypothetical protein